METKRLESETNGGNKVENNKRLELMETKGNDAKD